MQENSNEPPGGSQPAGAADWALQTYDLADWAVRTLLNRHDRYGGYRRREKDPVYTSPEDLRADDLDLTELLCRHFAWTGEYDQDSPWQPGSGRGGYADLIGLPSASRDETCRWVAADIDAHPPKTPKAGQAAPPPKPVDPEANLRFARHIYEMARAAGFAARLIDSDGKGGFHLWVVLATPIPMAAACRLGKWLTRDWAAFGLPKGVETLPKSDALSGERCGNWLRLPGRHHSRDHWSKVLDPEGEGWLEGRDAIDSLLALEGADVDLAGIIPADFDPDEKPKAKKAEAKAPRKAQVQARPSPEGRATPRAGGRARDHWPADPARDLALARAAVPYLTDDQADDYDT